MALPQLAPRPPSNPRTPVSASWRSGGRGELLGSTPTAQNGRPYGSAASLASMPGYPAPPPAQAPPVPPGQSYTQPQQAPAANGGAQYGGWYNT